LLSREDQSAGVLVAFAALVPGATLEVGVVVGVWTPETLETLEQPARKIRMMLTRTNRLRW